VKDGASSELIELDIAPGSQAVGKAVVDLDLPTAALIVLIHRDGKYLTANGETVIEPNDHLLIMADNKTTVEKVYQRFGMTALTH
jgi:cell volume regulation protein A